MEENREPAAPDEYQRRIDAWAANRFNATVRPGSTEIAVDAAAYASGAWCSIGVSWKDERGQIQAVTLADDAWQYEFGTVIREILATELPAASEGTENP